MSGSDLALDLNSARGTPESPGFTTPHGADPTVIALAERDGRAVQVLGLPSGYHVTFWSNGKDQGRGLASDTASVVGATAVWLRGVGLEQLAERYRFVSFSGLDLARERGNARAFQWASLADEKSSVYTELIRVAAEDPVLSRLFPRLGHKFVLFADEDAESPIATVFALGGHRYRIYSSAEGEIEFEGQATATVAYLVRRMK
ncbi:hypothetical protein AB0M28_32310 [Streptomyces sp. NPDC051940]|uniref:hypothetical protein n=1 Tax=Streptomyces sp. NPDC051940 TaxID=3155675 RepID=UPI00342DBC04